MKTQDVKLYAAQQLHRLQALPDNQRRAELAKLRRGIGHAPGELPELWGSGWARLTTNGMRQCRKICVRAQKQSFGGRNVRFAG